MNQAYFRQVLNEMFPNAKAELNYKNNFELLIAVVLSAQTTDISVNKVTIELFNKYPTPKKLMNATVDEVENIIKSIGLYKNKTKNIINLSKILYEKFDSKIPSERSDLESLPGVGRKTANVVLSNAFDVEALAVDTHVERVSKRLGLALESDTPFQVEMKLVDYFGNKNLRLLHHQLIFFGRYHCTARNPKCDVCLLKLKCPYFQKNLKK